jgi:probable phosphoglycerate mutase
MTTYFVRHGCTSYSAAYLVNGDPRVPVSLDENGVRQVETARPRIREKDIRTCVTSSFPRTRQTARLLLGEEYPAIVDPCLDEPDYGKFEGGPFLAYAAWLRRSGPFARPPGSGETQREALTRMVTALVRLPGTPAPRLVVAHGLMVSLLSWFSYRKPQDGLPSFFPEAPYLEPLAVSDPVLLEWAHCLSDELLGRGFSHEVGVGTGISSMDDRAVPSLSGPAPLFPEENESDA